MSNVLLSGDLFSEVLLTPARDGASDLYIISGYASSAMVFHHAEKLKEQNSDINIRDLSITPYGLNILIK